jgi:hypothetical protein
MASHGTACAGRSCLLGQLCGESLNAGANWPINIVRAKASEPAVINVELLTDRVGTSFRQPFLIQRLIWAAR